MNIKPAAFLSALVFSPLSIAQNLEPLGTEARALEEIIVTANKREQTLQQTPLSVSAFQADTVELLELSDLQQIAKNTPNLSLSSFSMAQPQAYIRGIGSNEDSAGGDSSVAFYVDGVYLSRPSAASFQQFDVERIEVLRGPQGTLYGKNATGGVINIITKQPSQQAQTAVKATVGSDKQRDLYVRSNLPLNEQLAVNFSASKRERDGYVINTRSGDRLQDVNDLFLRSQVRFTPRDNLQLTASVDYEEVDRSGNARQMVVGPESVFFSKDIRSNEAGTRGHQKRNAKGIRLQADWQNEFADLVAISGYRKSHYDWLDDMDGTDLSVPVLNIDNGAQDKAEQFSQEIRLSNTRDNNLFWLAGAYYLAETVHRTEYGTAAHMFLPFTTINNHDQRNRLSSQAIFGELSYPISEQLKVTVGARHSREKKDFSNTASGDPLSLYHPYSLLLETFDIKASNKWSNNSWKASADYQINDNAMIYGLIASGFKSGGFQGQASSASGASTAFNPEKVINYETGLKLNGDHWQLSSSVFYMDYRDLQVLQTTNIGTQITENAANANSRGLEIEYRVQLNDQWSSFGSYAYNDTEYQDFMSAAGDLSGNKLRNAPRNFYSVNVQHHVAMSHGANISSTVSYSFRDETYQDVNNFSVNQFAKRRLLDIHLNYQQVLANSHKLNVSLFAKNLTDEEYPVHAFDLGKGQRSFQTFGAPRSVGASVGYSF